MIQAQTSNTAAVNRTVATVLPPVDAIIAKPVRKTTPVTTENAAQPRLPSAAKRRPITMQAIANAVKPTPPAAKCSSPCQEIVPGPSGVPTGKPRAGSARNAPAAIRLAP